VGFIHYLIQNTGRLIDCKPQLLQGINHESAKHIAAMQKKLQFNKILLYNYYANFTSMVV